MSCVQEIRLSPADLEYLRDLVLAENDLDAESRHLSDELPSDELIAALQAVRP